MDMMGLKYSARSMSPLYAQVLAFTRDQLATAGHRPVIIGIQGPQGGGKTTLTRALLGALADAGVRAVAVSIDDFYMTREGQLAVAAAHPGNPYLEHRGYPGTHDVGLGAETLRALRAGRPTRVPVYDKSAHGGRGDRAPAAEWRLVEPPVDVVFLEGWMLGFSPVDDATLEDPRLAPANRALPAYQAWYDQIDAWIVLRAIDPNDVLEWRVEAEEKMKAEGKPGLSRADIEDYIRRFLPAYRTWGGLPAGASGLEITIDKTREKRAP
jgi:D-glycerate 3-kinase